MPDVEFTTAAGPAPGYLAVPAAGHGPATIIMQEWWGVDAHIRSVCDRMAGEGFFALAPDLFRGETASEPSAFAPGNDWLSPADAKVTVSLNAPDVVPALKVAVYACAEPAGM